MTEQFHTAEIFLKPHIVRWLAVKLSERHRNHTPHGNAIWRDMLQLLGSSTRLVQVQPDERNGRPTAKLRVALLLGEQGELTVHTNKKLALYAEAQYTKEFTNYVDKQYYGGLSSTKALAMEGFRMMYGITEDDLPLRNSIRCYERYEQRMGRRSRRGGSRPNSGPKPEKRPELQKRRGPYG